MLYNPPWFRTQQGLIGHILGGWTIAPLFTARSGAPERISTSTNGESFGEIYSGQTANYDSGFGSAPFTGGNSYHYNVPIVTGSSNPNGVATSGGASATSRLPDSSWTIIAWASGCTLMRTSSRYGKPLCQ